MRLCLVTETFPPEINGVAMTLRRLVEGLHAEGVEVEVIRPKQGAAAAEGVKPWLEFVVPGVPVPGYRGLQVGLPAWGTLASRWHTRRPDLVHVATEGPLGYSAIRTARRHAIPVISSFHTHFHRYTGHYGLGFAARALVSYLRHFHNHARLTLAPCAEVAAELHGLGVRRVGVMGRGVDGRAFSPKHRSDVLRARWGVEQDCPVVLYVGRVAREKNLPLVIETWQRMREADPRTKLVVVGGGPLLENLRIAHKDIIFTGPLPPAELSAHYASADVFLFASVTETFGNVVTEALASGLVVLAYDYAAPGQYIVSGKNGFKVPLGNAEAFKAAAVNLLRGRDKWSELRKSAAATGRTLTWDGVVRGYLKGVEEVLRSNAQAAFAPSPTNVPSTHPLI